MSQFITPSISSPPPRNLSGELNKIHKMETKFAPKDYALAAQYDPLYNQLDINKAGQNMLGYTDANGVYHPGTISLSTQANTAARTAGVADLQKLGGQASQSVLDSNPYLRGALNNLNARMGNSSLLNSLNTQAQSALDSNGQLSPAEQAAVDQQTRAAYAARGLTMSLPAVASEILNRDAAVRSRQAAAQQFASGVQGLNQAQNQFVAQGTQLDSSVLTNPVLSLLGQQSSVLPTATLSGGGISNGAYGPMPIQSYAQDLFNTNYNAGVNLGIAEGNNQAATRSAIASIAGGAIGSDERIKRDIVEVGTSPSGLRIVEFAYKEDPGIRYRGVIAQEVEKVRPDAVVASPNDGIKAVLYGKIDVKFEKIEESPRVVAQRRLDSLKLDAVKGES